MGTIAEYINLGLQYIIAYATDNLVPFMVIVFLLGIALRAIIYFTIHCEAAFALEFEKRVHKYLADPSYEHRFKSFHALTRRLLERTFEEHYELKKKLRRRRMDQLTTITDRMFMIPEGAKRLIGDTLSQTKYLHKGGKEPKFGDIARWVFESNPVFNRALGLFPIAVFHDILNILPGLFVIGGIFGTFLGVMQALPMLSEMDITNIESTKAIMDGFLLKMAFSMGTSVVGIILSVSMTMINALLNPDGTYYSMVNKFTSAMDFLWNDTSTNEVAASEQDTLSQDRRQLVYSSGGPTFEEGSREQELDSLPTQKELQALRREDSAVSDVPNDAQLDEIIQEFAVPEPIEPEVTLPDAEPGSTVSTIEPEAPVEESREEPGEESGEYPEAEAAREHDSLEGMETKPDSDSSEEETREWATYQSTNPFDEDKAPTGETDAAEATEVPQGALAAEQEPVTLSSTDEADLWGEEPGEEFVSEARVAEETDTIAESPSEPTPSEEETEDPTGLEEVFAQVDHLLSGVEPPSPSEHERQTEARIEVLSHRLKVLDEYLEKADADRLTGKMSEEMWKEETARYALEKEQLQGEIEILESGDEDKAA